MSALDFLEEVKKPTTLCAFCPKLCRFSCPVAETERREALTPGGKMSLLDWAGRGHTALDGEDEIGVLEACTDCGACGQYCTHDNPVAKTLAYVRAQSQTPRAQAYSLAFSQTGDVKGRDPSAVLAGRDSATSGQVGYFPGCQRLFHTSEKIAEDLALLEVASPGAVSLCALPPKGHCCGYPLVAEGLYDLYDAHLETLAEIFAGFDVIVTPDPGCLNALTATWAERGRGEPPHVVSVVEHLDAHREKFAGRSAGQRVRYHDACYLGRHRGVYDAPRRLLMSACERPPEEFAACKDDAVCSGQGGLYPTSAGGQSTEMAARVVSHDPHAQNGDIVVTACPSARRGFARAGLNVVELGDVLLGMDTKGSGAKEGES